MKPSATSRSEARMMLDLLMDWDSDDARPLARQLAAFVRLHPRTHGFTRPELKCIRRAL